MIATIIQNTLALFFFLFPLFFLPITADAYEYNKMMLLFITCLILFLFFCLKVIKRRRFVFIGGNFDILLFLLSAIALVSTLFQSPNIAVALTTPLSATTIIAGFIIYLLLVNLIDEKDREKLFPIFILDGVLISFYVILLYLGILPASQFTPAGLIFTTTIFLTIISIYILNKIIRDILNKIANESESSNLILYSIALLIIAGAAVLLTVHLFTDQKPVILSWAFGWPIFMEVAKNAKTLLLGIGSANFLTAFTLAKPLSFNGSAFWNTIFTSSSSFVLNLATENGVISALLYIFLVLSSVSQLIRHKITGVSDHCNYLIPLLAALIFQMIFPTSTAILTLTIVLLAFAATKKTLFTLDLARLGRLNYLLLLLPIALILAFSYFGGRAYLAEVFFKKSLDSLLNNDGTATYNYQKEAIKFNPYLDRYHVAFSQTNLALAQSLASKKELSDEDKQYLPRLVYQAIDHARTAVILYRTNIFNWDNLAKTYTSLINYATGADEWAIVSYRQKIALDPLSPNNHLALGNLYKLLNKFDLASEEFKNAIKLKGDLANAHYQLALMLKTEKKYQEAYNEYKTTLNLLKADTPEAETVKKEMAEIENLLPPQETTSPAGLKVTTSTNQTMDIQPIDSPIQNLPTPQNTITLPHPPITE